MSLTEPGQSGGLGLGDQPVQTGQAVVSLGGWLQGLLESLLPEACPFCL